MGLRHYLGTWPPEVTTNVLYFHLHTESTGMWESLESIAKYGASRYPGMIITPKNPHMVEPMELV